MQQVTGSSTVLRELSVGRTGSCDDELFHRTYPLELGALISEKDINPLPKTGLYVVETAKQ